MFALLCSSVCVRYVGCWHVPVLGPVAVFRRAKKEEATRRLA